MNRNLSPALHESRTHGSLLFPSAFYTSTPGAATFQVTPHWHEELEILYFQEGEFHLEINMETYQIDSECFYFVRSGELHRISCDGPCLESAMVFSPYLLSFVSNDDAQSRLLSPLASGELLLPRRILPEQECFAAIREEFQKIAGWYQTQTVPALLRETQQIFIKAGLLNILGQLSLHDQFSSVKEPRNENVENLKHVLSYIHEHYGERIYVRDLAALQNLNEQYFCRFFRRAIGQPPMAYVNEYRIRQAMGLLTDTDMPITDVCLECGFNNFGNFLREFRKHTGSTPLQYRKKKSRPDQTIDKY